MDFKNIPNKYRPIPFWSWNDKLDTEETARQIGLMHDAGMGGFFMHARGGLQTEYMGKEWFENISISIETAKRNGMYAWAYDENGWPSGFGGGIINGKGIEYQQKYLCREEYDGKEQENTIAVIDGMRYYYEVNPFYVDNLDGKVTAEFIKEIYEPYYEKFKNKLTGIFTDEPQIGCFGTAWSFVLPEEYKKAYGEEIYLRLPELFDDVGDYRKTRIKYWKLVTKLFSENYTKQIYNWCISHGLEFTGHLLAEESFGSQIGKNGAVMPHYEYFTIPGMDCLGRNIIYDLTSYQLGSVAAQLGKKQVLSESFALCGHNVSFNELKGIYQHQMVHGINLLCQHLEGYSLRGIRKRDYPPAMYYQQPWWKEYKAFCDGMSRIGMILAEGEIECNTLLLHPQTTAWTMYNGTISDELNEFYNKFKKVVNDLDRKHIHFHLGDEIIIERHGKVIGNKFVIGNMEYDTVIMPECEEVFENTQRLLEQFKENGGKIITPDEALMQTDIVDNPDILFTKRKFPDFDVYYFINHTKQRQNAKINIGSKTIDILTGEEKDFCGIYCFDGYESLLVIDDGNPQCEKIKGIKKSLDISGEWDIEKCDYNILTLDKCDYYFDGIIQEENGYVLNIQNRACEENRPVNIKMEYRVFIETVPKELYLLCEMPWLFDISVNGKNVTRRDEYEWAFDKSFKKIDVSEYVDTGENIISLSTVFKQSPEVYENLKKAQIYESEKNKLTYDMEIEPCYLMGDFGVRMEGNVENLDKDACRFTGKFIICGMPKSVQLKEIEKQGFPFWSGELTLTKEFCVKDTEHKLEFNPKGINAILVKVNGKACGKVLWAPFELDISEHLKIGKNTVSLTILNNLRNMLGPHHLENGESYMVAPASFYKEECVWLKKGPNVWPPDIGDWNDGYCFVETSIF